MVYKDFQGMKLSALGMGAMRLPVVDGNPSVIDVEKTREMVAYAMENGINYYDTAWGYHEGNSELVMGEILKEYPRESFNLATKFPGYDVSNMDKVEEIFEKQLEKLQVEYFDFYLFHNVNEGNINEYLDPKFGIYDYLVEQKKNGRIKHLGFSAHCTNETMEKFLAAYGDAMEFCQIQLNYIDYDYQDAKTKIDILSKRNIPIWVMEPVRGGKLADLPVDFQEKLRALRPDEEPVAWAFRFLQALGCVTMTLSGMSNFEQMKANIATYQEDKPLNEEEMKAIFELSAAMLAQNQIPCTSCRYCTTKCPKGIDIPAQLALYNSQNVTGKGVIPAWMTFDTPEEHRTTACIGCRSCEKVCPQNIKISEVFKDFVSRLAYN